MGHILFSLKISASYYKFYEKREENVKANNDWFSGLLS